MRCLNLFVILFMVFLAGCTAQKTDDVMMKDEPVTGDVDVKIENFKFVPAEITIEKGTTVVWTNLDSVQHTTTSKDGVFDSGLLSKDQSWTYTFNEVGTFDYHCILHPNMKGKIIVK